VMRPQSWSRAAPAPPPPPPPPAEQHGRGGAGRWVERHQGGARGVGWAGGATAVACCLFWLTHRPHERGRRELAEHHLLGHLDHALRITGVGPHTDVDLQLLGERGDVRRAAAARSARALEVMLEAALGTAAETAQRQQRPHHRERHRDWRPRLAAPRNGLTRVACCLVGLALRDHWLQVRARRGEPDDTDDERRHHPCEPHHAKSAGCLYERARGGGEVGLHAPNITTTSKTSCATVQHSMQVVISSSSSSSSSSSYSSYTSIELSRLVTGEAWPRRGRGDIGTLMATDGSILLTSSSAACHCSSICRRRWRSDSSLTRGWVLIAFMRLRTFRWFTYVNERLGGWARFTVAHAASMLSRDAQTSRIGSPVFSGGSVAALNSVSSLRVLLSASVSAMGLEGQRVEGRSSAGGALGALLSPPPGAPARRAALGTSRGRGKGSRGQAGGLLQR
jgi:hypothetical protein